MPMYLFRDESGHMREEFVMRSEDKGCQTHLCKLCQSTMAPIMAYGQGLLYFEEGRAQKIWNLGDQPVYVRSHEEHKRLMRINKVDFANRGTGYPGQWL